MFILFTIISFLFAAEAYTTGREGTLTKKVTVLNKLQRPTVRLKDIVQLQGIRSNFLVGYGLVVGLSGTGDSAMGSPNTRESLISMLERSGVNVREFASKFMGKSVASVMVTATLPSFARQGTNIDVTVSSLGDAKDLKGGTLVVTSLMGADGEVYAVAQGTIMTSSINATGRATTITRGVPTSGKIPGGAIVEKEVGFEFKDLPFHRIILTNPDCTTSKRIAETINQNFPNVAHAMDPTTIDLKIPKGKDKFHFLTEIESLNVMPDQKARIVIDQNEGVIVISDKVTINPSAVMHGSITVKIMEVPEVVPANILVQPNANYVQNQPITYADSPEKRLIDIKDAEIGRLRSAQEEQIKSLKMKQLNDLNNFSMYNPNATEEEKQQFREQQEQENRDLLLNQQEQARKIFENQAKELKNVKQENLNPQIANQITSSTVVDNTKVNIQEEKGLFAQVGGVSLEEVINSLNDIGANVQTIAAIINSLKSAGAIQAEIVVI